MNRLNKIRNANTAPSLAALSRAQLERLAHEKGIRFSARWGDAALIRHIEAA